MKNISLVCIFSLSLCQMFAQKESFDITNFIPPKNWDKNVKEGSFISYISSNKQKDSYCRITVFKSIASKGGINEDFENEWEELAAKSYKISDSVKTSGIQKYGNWDTKTGISTFTFNNNDNNIIILSTSTGFKKTTSLQIIYNNPDYDSTIANFLSSVSYKENGTTAPVIVENNNSTIQFSGKWARSISLSYNAGGMNSGYTKSIYNFKSDNSYTFTQRTWGMTAKYIYVVKETGLLKMNNNQVTLTPERSVVESWEHNGDTLVKLIATNERPLETMTYQFVIRYDDSMKDWDLILQTNNETLRDGKFSGIQPYPNGWYYSRRFSDYDLTAPKIFK
ncbi:hypothetical protein [Mariniflexile sp.]|uniref:hypothetical protein n=1 Tax=Mariniflexile sp. TaxID=1979402 RepID=UPI004047D0C3